MYLHLGTIIIGMATPELLKVPTIKTSKLHDNKTAQYMMKRLLQGIL